MNGYTQINVNGEPVGIKFGFPAIKEFAIATEKKREVFYDGDSLSFLGIAKLIQCGYNNNCEIKEVEPVLTLEDFNNWTEEAMNSEERKGELAVVLNAFAESQYVKLLTDLPKEEEAKKKTPKSTLRKSSAKS
jgi:hypothetical protein